MDKNINEISNQGESTVSNAASEAQALLAAFRGVNNSNQQQFSGTLDFGTADDLYNRTATASISQINESRAADREERTRSARPPEPEQPHVTRDSGAHLTGSLLSPRPQAE